MKTPEEYTEELFTALKGDIEDRAYTRKYIEVFLLRVMTEISIRTLVENKQEDNERLKDAGFRCR